MPKVDVQDGAAAHRSYVGRQKQNLLMTIPSNFQLREAFRLKLCKLALTRAALGFWMKVLPRRWQLFPCTIIEPDFRGNDGGCLL